MGHSTLLVELMLASVACSLGLEREPDATTDRELRYHYPTAEESQHYYPYQEYEHQYEQPHYYTVPCQPSVDAHPGLSKLVPLGSGLVSSVAKALATGLSAKLPLILFKILLKVGLLYLALPLVASFVVPASPVTVTGNFTAGGRRADHAADTRRHGACVRRFACQMGAHSPATAHLARYMKNILETSGPEANRSLQSYKEAYIKGKAEKTCRHYYPCEYLDEFIEMLS